MAGQDVVGTICTHILLDRLNAVTTYKKGGWEVKSSGVLCVKAPGKLLMPGNFPLIQLKSEYDYLLSPRQCLPPITELSPLLPLHNLDIYCCPTY